MQTYVVTGTAGFIASKVAERLLAAGHRVLGIDNLNDAYDVRLKHWRLDRLREKPNFDFVTGDIADYEAARTLVGKTKVDAILNLAARAGVRQSVEQPQVYVDANITGTLNLLRAAVEFGVEKFVLSSTSSLYGGENPRPYVETQRTQPLSPYAASKQAAEGYCFTYHYLFGLDVTVLRYFTVYGPAGRPDMSLFRFVQWISEGQPVRIFGDGQQERDFTYVDDVAAATVAAIRPLGFEVINVGNDQPVRLLDAVRLVEQATGRQATLDFKPMHKADMQATWANIDKANRLLNWRPDVRLEAGVAALVAWYNENRAWAREIETGI